jgi:hypothetical protein
VGVVAAGAGGADAADQRARAHRELLVARENWLATKLELYGYPPPATTLTEYSAPPARSDDEGDSGSGQAGSPAGSALGEAPDVK